MLASSLQHFTKFHMLVRSSELAKDLASKVTPTLLRSGPNVRLGVARRREGSSLIKSNSSATRPSAMMRLDSNSRNRAVLPLPEQEQQADDSGSESPH
jgi:hypothetical protein